MSENDYDFSGMTTEQLRSEQRTVDPYTEGEKVLALENELRERNKPPDVRVPRSASKALQMTGGDEISLENLAEWKMDRRYCGSVSERSSAYCAAIAKAVEELAAATEKAEKQRAARK